MAWRARQRSENRRAGGLKGRDRGWLPGSSQANAIGIPNHLVNKVRERTTTLVTEDAAANIAGGPLTEPLPYTCDDGNVLIDTRCLVVNTNQLSGIGRYRSQFNVDADGIKQARYYLPVDPKGFISEKCTCKRPGCFICINNENNFNNENNENILITASLNPLRISTILFAGHFGPNNGNGSDYTIPVAISENGNTIGHRYIYGNQYLAASDTWAGFAYVSNPAVNLTFIYGGKIRYNYERTEQSGEGTNTIRIQCENLPYPSNDILLTFTGTTINEGEIGFDEIDIAPEGSSGTTFTNIILYLTSSGKIKLTNIEIQEFTNAAQTEYTTIILNNFSPFGNGASISSDNVYEFGTFNWSGFQNENPRNLYPVLFNNSGSKIAFNYNNSENYDMKIKFKFERFSSTFFGSYNPANTEPSYTTDTITLPKNDTGKISIPIPSQGTNEFNNIILYLCNEGQLEITNIELTNDSRSILFPNATSIGSDNMIRQGVVFDYESTGWGRMQTINNEIQIYDENNAEILSDGSLKITCGKGQSILNKLSVLSSRLIAYSSPEMPFITIQKGKKTHIKITAKLPIARDGGGNAIPGVPLWPALWLLGTEFKFGINWPFCGEIDIMEFASNKYAPNIYSSAVHYADNQNNHTYEYKEHITNKNLTETFNDFEIIIYAGTDSTQNKIDILINSVKIHPYFDNNSINKELFEASDGSDVKYYDLIFNIAIAGDFVGLPWNVLSLDNRLDKILNDYTNWNSVSEMEIRNLSVTMEDYVV